MRWLVVLALVACTPSEDASRASASSCSITLGAANPKPAIKLLALLALAIFARRRVQRAPY